MKKLDNKGMTLVELIVSFVIVSVAFVYFYQTVSTVSKLYSTSTNETREFVDKTYLEKLFSAIADKEYPSGGIRTTKSKISTLCDNLDECKNGSIDVKGAGTISSAIIGTERREQSNWFVISFKTRSGNPYYIYKAK